MPINFDNRFARKFPEITTRQPIKPDGAVKLLWFNSPLWTQLSGEQTPPPDLSEKLGGRAPWQGSDPVAQKYAGHQFGHFNPYLGDGRGLLLGQMVSDGDYYDLHIKGAGPTPYSRGADGRAVLRSSIRELLASEALHALGIASTRALALLSTEGRIQRERVEPGAMLARVAATHVRFGHFEHCLHRGLDDTMKRLWDDTIATLWPHLEPTSVAEGFAQVVEKTTDMIAGWQAYGFIHGVMNTDNMSLAGETFDYGPYAFLDNYQPEKIFNHTDHAGRYGFIQQPGVGLWNLKKLAQAIGPIVGIDELTPELERYEPSLRAKYLKRMSQRLGLPDTLSADTRMSLIGGWLSLLNVADADYQLSFRELIDSVKQGEPQGVLASHGTSWWQGYLEAVDHTPALEIMERVNPWVIVRTHLAQRVINAAEAGDGSLLEQYLSALTSPFSEHWRNSPWAKPPTAEEQVSQLSCSS